MLLAYATWPEIAAYLERSQTIIVPIGSNEQHGPTGLLGTDWMCPELIAHQAQRSADILVAPTFNIGMAQHHLAFPGTISLRPSTFMAAIVDWVASLKAQGFRQIYFLNGHGGNVASIEAAFSEIYAGASFENRRFNAVLRLRSWWMLPGVEKICRELYPHGHGVHATPSEIAITQWGYPEHVEHASIDPLIAPEGPVREAADFRARFPDGRIGSNPALARPGDGERLVEAAASALIADVAAHW